MTTLSIGQAADLLGVCVNTLRNWHKSGELIPRFRTKGGHRRYDDKDIAVIRNDDNQSVNKTIAYARVSTHDQKVDLTTQITRLRLECQTRGYVNTKSFPTSAPG